MWNTLPSDLLSHIFSSLSPDSLARATSACRHWNTCAKAYPPLTTVRHPPWFLALPTRHRGQCCCYAHNPTSNTWYVLPLSFLPDPVRPIAPIGGLILFRPANSTILQLATCNPFTRQFRNLPNLIIARTNPALGIVVSETDPFPFFKIYVAGGMSEAPRGGATYETTLEIYDSKDDKWQIMGPMPVEFAVRLTVWTPNESVYSNGVLYWMTSARAYSAMGFEIESKTWRELGVPMAERLEFGALVQRNGKLTLVGGTGGEGACVWELGEGGVWDLIEKVPVELEVKFLGEKGSWGSTKCVGSEEGIWLYREIGSGMVVWREVGDEGKWEWSWVDGCCSVSKQVGNLAIKGLILHPNLMPSHNSRDTKLC